MHVNCTFFLSLLYNLLDFCTFPFKLFYISSSNKVVNFWPHQIIQRANPQKPTTNIHQHQIVNNGLWPNLACLYEASGCLFPNCVLLVTACNFRMILREGWERALCNCWLSFLKKVNVGLSAACTGYFHCIDYEIFWKSDQHH